MRSVTDQETRSKQGTSQEDEQEVEMWWLLITSVGQAPKKHCSTTFPTMQQNIASFSPVGTRRLHDVDVSHTACDKDQHTGNISVNSKRRKEASLFLFFSHLKTISSLSGLWHFTDPITVTASLSFLALNYTLCSAGGKTKRAKTSTGLEYTEPGNQCSRWSSRAAVWSW